MVGLLVVVSTEEAVEGERGGGGLVVDIVVVDLEGVECWDATEGGALRWGFGYGYRRGLNLDCCDGG